MVSIEVSYLLVFAAGSDFPPAQRCEQCSQSASSAAAAGKAAAAGSARWCSDRPEWHYGASPAGWTPKEQENQMYVSQGLCREEQTRADGRHMAL